MRLVVVGTLAVASVAVVMAAARDHGPEAPAPAPIARRAPTPVPADGPTLANQAAYVPLQCYAKTRSSDGKVHNSCATCHQQSREPNYVDDADVQSQLSMPRFATENRWTNALQPVAPASVDDAALRAWVRTDNHRGADLSGTSNDGEPCAFAPDKAGWDRDEHGELTGWRAYAYAPLPGMFWPTNGSAGDAFIRLPAAYRNDASGHPSTAIYALNLSILEAMIRRADVAIVPTDEAALDLDLDADGRLATAKKVAFRWPPGTARKLHYVGQAATLDPDTAGWPAAGLYPVGTELLHSLRYLDVVDGRVRPAARMKEVRYIRKARWLSYSTLDLEAKKEQREKEQNPDRLRRILGDEVRGVGTGTGWTIQGFVEAADGNLRRQTLEETAACIGCHGGVGATVDSTFSFARKVAGDAGWYGWGARGFTGIAEPVRADGRGEYRVYLEQVGGGDDYRSNAEVRRLAFAADGSVLPDVARRFAKDISALVVPSPDRALALDRSYLALVRAQSFVRGRDAFVGTPELEVRLVQDASTGVTEPLAPSWQPAARR